MPDLAVAFSEIHRALHDDLLAATPQQWAAPIPIRPQWTVKDTVAMLTGFAEALIDGNWTEDYSDSWSDHSIRDRLHERMDGLIAARRDRAGDEVLKEWDGHAAKLERMLAGEDPFPAGTHPFVAWSYLWAVVQNSYNVWAALGIVKTRNFQATILCLESAVMWLDMRLQAKNKPALRIRAGTTEWVVGDGAPAATVTAPAFELFRALSGRRSLSQIREFDWDGDAEEFMDVISPFEPPKEAFVE